jgi:hypothetical protein
LHVNLPVCFVSHILFVAQTMTNLLFLFFNFFTQSALPSATSAADSRFPALRTSSAADAHSVNSDPNHLTASGTSETPAALADSFLGSSVTRDHADEQPVTTSSAISATTASQVDSFLGSSVTRTQAHNQVRFLVYKLQHLVPSTVSIVHR